MQKVIILTEEEYNALLGKSKEASNSDIEYLKACETSLFAFTNPTRVCPKCGKAMLVEGFICPSCGYDDSEYDE